MLLAGPRYVELCVEDIKGEDRFHTLFLTKKQNRREDDCGDTQNQTKQSRGLEFPFRRVENGSWRNRTRNIRQLTFGATEMNEVIAQRCAALFQHRGEREGELYRLFLRENNYLAWSYTVRTVTFG
jgi:hypothetical protein